MEESKLDPSNGTVSNATRSRELEVRYIYLLEKRVAALEALTKDQKPPVSEILSFIIAPVFCPIVVTEGMGFRAQ